MNTVLPLPFKGLPLAKLDEILQGNMPYADSEAPNQPAHLYMFDLNATCTVRCLVNETLYTCSIIADSVVLSSDCTYAQADQELHCRQRSEDPFYHDADQI